MIQLIYLFVFSWNFNSVESPESQRIGYVSIFWSIRFLVLNKRNWILHQEPILLLNNQRIKILRTENKFWCYFKWPHYIIDHINIDLGKAWSMVRTFRISIYYTAKCVFLFQFIFETVNFLNAFLIILISIWYWKKF